MKRAASNTLLLTDLRHSVRVVIWTVQFDTVYEYTEYTVYDTVYELGGHEVLQCYL